MMNRRALLSAMSTALGGLAFPLAPHAFAREGDGRRADPNKHRHSPLFKTPIEVTDLKYDAAALSPVISSTTVGFHYGKHHIGYLNNLKGLLSAEELASSSLEEVILRHGPGRHDGAPSSVFNNAAQVWNHNFYWDSLRPQAGGAPGATLARAIEESFGSLDALRDKMTAACVAQFGSGWAWLVRERRSHKLGIVTTSNALTPLSNPDLVPLLVIDVWEHAYYLDYQNKRADYAKAVFDKLLNWDFAERNFYL